MRAPMLIGANRIACRCCGLPKLSSSSRYAAAITIGKNRPDQSAEAFGLFVMQITGHAERMTCDVDELLQLGRALLGVANDGEPCARPDAGNGSPQMRRGEVAVLARELLHVLIGYRLREQRLYIPLLGCTLHQ